MYTSLQEYKELFTITIIPCNTIDTNDVSFHGVRRVQIDPDFYPDTINSWCQKYWMIQNFYKGQLIQGFQQGFHCVILDLKDLTSAELFLRNIDLQ